MKGPSTLICPMSRSFYNLPHDSITCPLYAKRAAIMPMKPKPAAPDAMCMLAAALLFEEAVEVEELLVELPVEEELELEVIDAEVEEAELGDEEVAAAEAVEVDAVEVMVDMVDEVELEVPEVLAVELENDTEVVDEPEETTWNWPD